MKKFIFFCTGMILFVGLVSVVCLSKNLSNSAKHNNTVSSKITVVANKGQNQAHSVSKAQVVASPKANEEQEMPKTGISDFPVELIKVAIFTTILVGYLQSRH